MRQIKCYDHNMSSRINIWGKGLPSARKEKKKTESLAQPKSKRRRIRRSYPPEELAQHLPEIAKARESVVPEAKSEPVPEPEPAPQPEPAIETVEPTLEEPKTVKRYRVLKRRQRRRSCMSISVSEEEEDILREAAGESGLSFSSWARDALFRAAKRKIPNRPH